MGSESPSSGSDAPPRRRGRPRAVDVDERVLAAARAITVEVGYDATTIEAVAARAGVAKTAIYRRWPNKAVLVYDAVLRAADQHTAVPDTGDVRADLLAVLHTNAAGFRAPSTRGLIAALSGEALRDERVAEMLRDRFFGPRADAIAERVATAVARRELRPTVDAALVPALLTGSLQYLWIVRGSALADDDLARVVEAVIGPHVRTRRGPRGSAGGAATG
jgi:AcrR family transcriptional regulator